MNDLEGVLDNAHGEQLFAVVTAVHHERAAQTLHNRAGALAKALRLVTAGRVW